MRLIPRVGLAALAAIALAVGMGGSATAARTPSAPPAPLIVTGEGHPRHAAAGSYCWAYGNHGICADTLDPMTYAPRLHSRAGETVTVRMGFPVRKLSATTDDGGDLGLQPRGERNRKFTLDTSALPAGRTTGIYLFALYAEGDGMFAFELKPRIR